MLSKDGVTETMVEVEEKSALRMNDIYSRWILLSNRNTVSALDADMGDSLLSYRLSASCTVSCKANHAIIFSSTLL